MRTIVLTLALAVAAQTARADETDQLYLDAGRPDLVAARAARRNLARLTLAAGVIATGIGVVALVHASTESGPPPSNLPVSSEWIAMGGGAGPNIAGDMRASEGVLALGGVLLLLSAYAYTHIDPISDDEAADLVRERRLHLSASAGVHGGGLAVVGRF